jgi:hypothetical protein
MPRPVCDRAPPRARQYSADCWVSWLPGKAALAHRAGANLAPERAVGRRTWEEFLAERVPRSAA